MTMLVQLTSNKIHLAIPGLQKPVGVKNPKSRVIGPAQPNVPLTYA
jgi:hypothetical protein